ncbi:MAG: hypothetical protein OEY87_03435 [Gammaproteobacteria bacterium]|nr:hypothetical protein [Gammaproteobacteria bacterium]MDH5735155.1 hypothetical protein [Gammaproteobacteria bacterium]
MDCITPYRFFYLLMLFAILFVQGCATSAYKSMDMRAALAQGRPDVALKAMEKESATDDVMVNMNRGILLRMLGDFNGSNQALELAKKKIEDLYATSLSEQVGALMLNDETISFEGDRYEQVLVHAFKALNYIALGDMDAARVEVLQSDVKMMEWGEAPEEDPFMRYLAGIVFEALGEYDEAIVSYRKAVEVYRATKDKQGLNIPLQLQNDFLRLLSQQRRWNEFKHYKQKFAQGSWAMPDTRGMGELIVLLHNGMTPQRNQVSINTWSSELSLNVRIALPAYSQPAKNLNPVRLTVGNEQLLLETVENIDGLARAALRADMPVITTRAIARAVVKKKSEKKIEERQGGLAQLAMFIVNQATEIADTRCWNTLPQEIQIARLFLPAGQQLVRLEVIGPGGTIVDVIELSANILQGKKTILSEHWTAPRPAADKVAVNTESATKVVF